MAKNDQAPLQTTPNMQSLQQQHYTPSQILDKARHHWPHILECLGINSSYLKNKHGPCPACQGKDRFRFDNKEGEGTFFCNQCGAGNGVKLLQLYHDWNYRDVLNKIAEILGVNLEKPAYINYKQPEHISQPLARAIKATFPQLDDKDIIKRRKLLAATWQQSNLITNDDPVDRYLKARGIVLDAYPKILRYHPQLPYYDNGILTGNFPAMLALVQDKNNQNITLHRTFLGDGCKANVPEPKKLMPPIIPGASNGAAIKLYEPDGGVLVVAEGIETALAFNIATKIPIWATISAGGMEKINLPQNVREVIIAVDNDQSGRGQEAASKLVKRLLIEGRTVRRVIPPNVGDDFADMLMRGEL